MNCVMMKSSVILLLAVFFLTITYVSSIVCTKNFCQTVKCAEPCCGKGEKYVERGSACGCCDVCYKILSKKRKKTYWWYTVVFFAEKYRIEIQSDKVFMSSNFNASSQS